jgi:SAM-dependent methyltransferase
MRAMIVDLIVRTLRLPAARRRLWRSWYQYLARGDSGRDWTFMNYGYEGETPLELPAEREADRYCIQLYDLLASATPLEGLEVLEVGSGRGGGAAWVHERHRPARMVGADYTPANVDFCRAAHPAEGLEFVVGDAEALPFADGRFDALINLESSHCYGSRARFYARAERVLRPGGAFLHADIFDAAEVGEVRKALAGSGLEVESERDIGAEVIEAMDRDDARKRAFIKERVPGWLIGLFGQFAGLQGSRVHENLRSGELRYLLFLARA